MLHCINRRATRFGFAFLLLIAPLFFLSAAQAETDAQRDVARERVVKEATKLQHQQRYTIKLDGKTIRVTPEARYTIWGNTDQDAETTLRWRIRVRTKPQTGTAGWLVCRGRVTVRPIDPSTFDPNNASNLKAALATDSCVA